MMNGEIRIMPQIPKNKPILQHRSQMSNESRLKTILKVVRIYMGKDLVKGCVKNDENIGLDLALSRVLIHNCA